MAFLLSSRGFVWALFACCCLSAATALQVAVLSEDLPDNYTDFLHKYALLERHANESHELRHEREQAFWQRHAFAVAQNRRAGARWTAAASHLFDATDAELKRLLGYKRARRSHKGLGFLATRETPGAQPLLTAIPDDVVLPQAVDWRGSTKYSNRVRYQGNCGSCWAISSGNALEMHAELAGLSAEVAIDQLVTCVENRKHCGGTGGCDGATSELAFEYVRDHGLAFQSGYQPSCKAQGRRIKARDFVHLTPNVGRPLQTALAIQGPVVVSADAANWMAYGSGIFDGCGPNAAPNHAVLAIGYGKADAGKYWLIRNSWGDEWGEKGHIRILRFDDEEKSSTGHYCGTDSRPQDGVGCDGGPESMPVCGMCGILFDSAYPVGVEVVDVEQSPVTPAKASSKQ